MRKKAISEGFSDVDVKQGIVCGYFAHFGSKDSDGDIIVKGAFSKTLQENGPQGKDLIAHLLDHKRDNAIGRIKVLEEDQTGLKYESQAGRHTQGRDFLLMVEDGIIKNHSVGFITVKELQKSDANYMTELSLKEGSSLQFWGANTNTPITGLKSESVDELAERIALLTKAIRNGKYSDATFKHLEFELQSINNAIISLKDAKPGLSTLEIVEPNSEDLIKGLTQVFNNTKWTKN